MPKTKQSATVFAEWNYDTRIVQRNIHDLVLTAADVKAYMETLPDVAAKAEPLRTNWHEVDDDDDGDDGIGAPSE